MEPDLAKDKQNKEQKQNSAFIIYLSPGTGDELCY